MVDKRPRPLRYRVYWIKADDRAWRINGTTTTEWGHAYSMVQHPTIAHAMVEVRQMAHRESFADLQDAEVSVVQVSPTLERAFIVDLGDPWILEREEYTGRSDDPSMAACIRRHSGTSIYSSDNSIGGGVGGGVGDGAGPAAGKSRGGGAGSSGGGASPLRAASY